MGRPHGVNECDDVMYGFSPLAAAAVAAVAAAAAAEGRKQVNS